jgi:autotransporter-associated beta strand protein
MKSKLIPLFTAAALTAPATAQTQNYFGTSGTLNGNVWSTNPAGPYTSALVTTGGAIINFDNAATFTGASITVAGINATANATGTAGGTISNFNNGVIPISVASGVTLNFGGQAFTSSATAGYIKNGDGTLVMAGNTYGGGFTLNAGTIAVAGVNAMGSAAGNTLTINGGTIRSNSTTARDLSGRYSGGITIGGDFALGDSTNTGTLTFSDAINLGAASRTIQVDSAALFGGIISGSTGVGITKTGAGSLTIGASTANAMTGDIVVKDGRLNLANHAGAAGTGAITLGDTTGSAAATLSVNNSIIPTNALTIASGSSGVKTLTTGNVGSPGYNGAITLNDNLTVAMLNTGTANTNFTFAGSGTINLNANTLNLSLAQGTTGNTNTATITLNKPVVGSGGIVISGSGVSTGARTVALSGTNTYTGGTSVGGTGTSRPLVVSVSGDQSAASGGWNIDVNNETSGVSTTVNFAAGSTVGVASGKAITLGGTAGHFSARTLNAAGTVTNDGGLLVRRSSTVNVTGTWTQNGSATLATQGGGAATLNIGSGGAFTYTSGSNFAINTSTSADTFTNLSVTGGTLTTGRAFRNNSSTTATNNFAQINLDDGGTLKLSANIADLLTTAGGNIRMRLGETGTGGVIDTNGFDTTIDKEITDITGQAGKLTKQGDGTLTLDGNNTYTGATTVSAGTLLVNGSLGTTAVTVAAGATIGGTGSLGGSLAFGGTSLLEVVDLSEPLAVAGPITFGSGFGIANLLGIDWDLVALGSHTLISTSQEFGATDLANFGFDNRVAVGSSDREAYFTSGSLAVVVVPEPAAALLGSLGLLALLRRRRG